MFCNNCGSEINNGSSFCTSCGARVVLNNSNSYQYGAAQNPQESYSYVSQADTQPYAQSNGQVYNNYAYNQYYRQEDNLHSEQMQIALISKLKSVKSKALAGAIMCFVAAIIQIILNLIPGLISVFAGLVENNFDFMNRNFQENASLWSIMIVLIAVQSIIIAIVTFIPMYKKYKGVSELLKKIQFEYNQAEVDAFFANYKTGFMQFVRVLDIWQSLGIITIPLFIAQIIASFAIINLKKDYNNMMMQYNNYRVNQYS